MPPFFIICCQMKFKDYYGILGVNADSNPLEILNAYRTLSKLHHPDKKQHQTEKHTEGELIDFYDITEAYETLKDVEKRALYDKGYESNMLLLGHSSNKKGNNRYLSLSLSLKESKAGAEKTISYQRYKHCSNCCETQEAYVTCSRCGGSGKQKMAGFDMDCDACYGEGKVKKSKCPTCQGKGKMLCNETVNISIESGAVVGDVIFVVKGGGDVSDNNIDENLYGDLIVSLGKLLIPEYFRRVGNHLIYELSLSVIDLMLGTSVKVPIVDGGLVLEIPAGTQPGKLYELKGLGVEDHTNLSLSGSQLILINASIPTYLTYEEKEAIGKLKKLKNVSTPPQAPKTSILSGLGTLFESSSDV